MQINSINSGYNNPTMLNFKAYNKTFAMLKPGFEECEKEVVKMFNDKGLCVEKRVVRTLSEDLAKKHYINKADKPYYGEITDYITSGPVVEMLIAGDEAINKVRSMTDSIRQKFGFGDVMKNVIHSSDSKQAANREIALHFNAQV